MKQLLDCHEKVINEGDFIAYATTNQIWVGKVIRLLEYKGDYETIYKIQILADEGGGKERMITFEHLGWKIYKINKCPGPHLVKADDEGFDW